MSHDMLFRIILAGLASFQFSSHLAHKKRSSRATPVTGFGEVAMMFSACLWTVCLSGYVAGLTWFSPSISLPEWIRWFGVATMVACVPLSIWTYRTLGVHFSMKLHLLEDHRLVTEGPYRFVRHPMYSTLCLCVCATVVISENVIVMIAGSLLVAAMLFRISKEDKLLQERFGDSHKLYMKRTGAILPKMA